MSQARDARVYPRVRGGTTAVGGSRMFLLGLSPRARGNLLRKVSSNAETRSIPACAGEPPPAGRGNPPTRVYPRVRGGTKTTKSRAGGRCGLSPRARGNPFHSERYLGLSRSIPACAGEPRTRGMRKAGSWVYPRVRGGTTQGGNANDSGLGLSPRARGNPAEVITRRTLLRSIPACAGEPRQERLRFRRVKVYPRVRGGTVTTPSGKQGVRGLSPRARGNLSFR